MSIAKITPAFIAAKKQFSPALKQRENSHFKNKYADLGACIDAVNDALLANGIAMYQETFDDPNGITIETVFLHESTETIRSGKLHVPASKQDAQGYGSALTYARRYSLMAACGIAPEDDDGNAATKAPPIKKTISATDGALDNLGKQERLRAERLAVAISSAFAAGEDWGGFETYEGEADQEVRIGIWSLLQSNVRSKLKHMKTEANKPVTA